MDGGKFGKGRIVPRDNGRRARLGRAVFGEIRATAGIVGIDAEAGRGRKRGSLLDAVTLYINFTCLPIPYIHPTSSLVHPYARPSIARSILTHCPFPLPTSLLFRTVNLSFLFRSSRFLRLLSFVAKCNQPTLGVRIIERFLRCDRWSEEAERNRLFLARNYSARRFIENERIDRGIDGTRNSSRVDRRERNGNLAGKVIQNSRRTHVIQSPV